MQGKRSKAVSPVLATLLMIAVAVSMSVILFMWSQNFLASTSQAASTQQQAQNVAAQSSIAIESVQFLDEDVDDDGALENIDLDGDTDNDVAEDIDGDSTIDYTLVKIIVRNVGSSKVTIAQVYMGTNAYQMTAYPAYKVMKTTWSTYDTNYDDAAGASYTIIGEDEGTTDYVWYVSEAAFNTNDVDTYADDGSDQGYLGSLTSIYGKYLALSSNENVNLVQNTDTAVVYVFDKNGSADTDGELDPQGFAVIHLYLSSPWSAGETYYIRVTTTVGTFADITVTAPTS